MIACGPAPDDGAGLARTAQSARFDHLLCEIVVVFALILIIPGQRQAVRG
jgi:hypothetical protein